MTEAITLLQVINGYMNLLQRSHKHVFVFPSYQAVLWDNDRYTWLWLKVMMLVCLPLRKIILAASSYCQQI